MSDLLATLFVFGLFLIRLGIPLLVLGLVSYALHRLDVRWQQEEALYRG
jgi:hypothetical protein